MPGFIKEFCLPKCGLDVVSNAAHGSYENLLAGLLPVWYTKRRENDQSIDNLLSVKIISYALSLIAVPGIMPLGMHNNLPTLNTISYFRAAGLFFGTLILFV